MDKLYVAARGVLLDAIQGLGPHRKALTLVGAQAVYLRVGEADIAVAPTTTDADLSLDPELLGDDPGLDTLMELAGFEPKLSASGTRLVGIWVHSSTPHGASIDLLMADGVAPPAGRRAARLPAHGSGSILKVPGIEAALIDADDMTISALDPADSRSFTIRVAGPGALLVAKLHKIGDRSLDARRLNDKDALDVFRLLRGTLTPDLGARLQECRHNARSRNATEQALTMFEEMFGNPSAVGAAMLLRATAGLMDPAETLQSLDALVDDLKILLNDSK